MKHLDKKHAVRSSETGRFVSRDEAFRYVGKRFGRALTRLSDR